MAINVPANVRYPVNITKTEEKFINKTFKEATKPSHQKETSRRNDDAGVEAAVTCLARDLVTANFEESKLITAKMSFLQQFMNGNLQTDSEILTRRANDKIGLIAAKSDATSKTAPARAQVIDAVGNNTVKVIDSASQAIPTAVKAIKPLDVVV